MVTALALLDPLTIAFSATILQQAATNALKPTLLMEKDAHHAQVVANHALPIQAVTLNAEN